MLTFGQLIGAVERLVKGFSPEKMEEAINSSMVDFVTDFHLPFLVRKYYIKATTVGDLGPFTVYEDEAGAVKADFVEPCAHPNMSHVSGLVDSCDNRIPFRLQGEEVYLTNDGWVGDSTYYFWCLKTPKKFSATNTIANQLIAETDFPEYCKSALANKVASYLSFYKNDLDRMKLFESIYKMDKGPQAKLKASGDWGIRNSGDTSKADNGGNLEWI